MLFKSIRWRLSITYAAIALLVALSLGAVLIFTVRQYYLNRELSYLSQNATFIGAAMTQYLQDSTSNTDEQSLLRSLSFLTRTRIRLFDPEGKLLADSGSPSFTRVNLTSKQMIIRENAADPGASVIVLSQSSQGSGLPQLPKLSNNPSNSPIGDQGGTVNRLYISSIPVSSTPFGLGLNTDLGDQDKTPSSQVVRQPIQGASGRVMGSVELSEGPAYGHDVVSSVARGWAIASSVGVLLAIVAGWLISRYISAPVVALTEVTQRMAEGDLFVRAQEDQAGEFGVLAQVYNSMAGQVEETIHTLRRFVADAAHELQTPLTALRTNLELVSNGGNPEQTRTYLRAAQSQVDRLNALTRDLLDLSRLEAGVENWEPAPLDLIALIRRISEYFAARAEQEGMDFRLSLPGNPFVVEGEERYLERAITNLMDNAIKFTPEGGTVSISVSEIDDWAIVKVEDTGIGIPPDEFEGLFSRFHRGSNARAYPGSGLGLPIARTIIRAHNGRITAENLNPGARFTIYLPSK